MFLLSGSCFDNLPNNTQIKKLWHSHRCHSMHPNDAKKERFTTIRKYYKVPRKEIKYIVALEKLQFFCVSFVRRGSFISLLICIVDYRVVLYNIQNICCSCFSFSSFLVSFMFMFMCALQIPLRQSFISCCDSELQKLNNTTQQFHKNFFSVRSLAENGKAHIYCDQK